ncbi:nitroreductase family protein [Thauera aromatica]|uniref:Oxygen-insensitive NADPH nitroreductase n=1 Tax=Thauera aromatica K172 TaxID=44139 RepID=A0A2R4BL24_THAAR|nr:nitroreductase family protein [Thauera aromatica]AVR87962.1 Oxygen-insensitive NADPH nitroreductase [Thauera aromatica K172]
MTAQRLSARYGGESAPATDALNPFIEHLLDHRSVRAFLPDPVSDAQLAAIIAAAQSAASSSNLNVWSVVAVRDAARREQLAELAGGQAHVRDAPLQLVWLADLARLRRVATALERPSAGLDYLEMFLTGVIDAALAAQNAAVAAESLGLGMVYIGGMRNRPEEVARLLELPPEVFAVFGMCVGTPDPARPAAVKPRPPQSVVLHHETYSQSIQDEGVEAYNQAMARFYEAQRMNVHGSWAVHSAKRIAGPETLSGRHCLVDALHALGFGLK